MATIGSPSIFPMNTDFYGKLTAKVDTQKYSKLDTSLTLENKSSRKNVENNLVNDSVMRYSIDIEDSRTLATNVTDDAITYNSCDDLSESDEKHTMPPASCNNVKETHFSNSNSLKENNCSHTPSTPLLTDASLLELICITSYNFPYGFICGTFGLWILPAEAQRLFPNVQSLTLGLSLGIVGLSQLVCPIAGKVSDMHLSTTKFGKRRPYILWGSFVASLATCGMRWSSLYFWGLTYYLFLFIGMTSLNVAYAVQCGLVPDALDEQLQGKSSGLVAVHTLLGSATGFALVMLTSHFDFHYVYFIYIVLVIIACIATWWVALKLERRSVLLGSNKLSLSEISPNITGRRCLYDHLEKTSNLNVMKADASEWQTDDSNTYQSNFTNEKAFLPPSNNNRSKSDNIKHSFELEDNNKTTFNLVEDITGTKDIAYCTPTSAHHARGITVDINKSQREENSTAMPSTNTLGSSTTEVCGDDKQDTASDVECFPHHSSSRKSLSSHNYGRKCAYHGLGHNDQSLEHRSLNWATLLKAFSIDMSESYDFFWVFLGRSLYYVGVSVQAFMLYFLRDVVGTPTEAEQQYQIGCIALVAQFTAAAVAYPIGALTDTKGCGKKSLIYVACMSMSVVYFGFLLAPLFGKNAFNYVLSTAVLYGAGNGCFLAVDYALALATLPKSNNTTQALGLWGVAAFVGSAIGPLLWGGLIEIYGRNPVTNGYWYGGYVIMLMGGILATLLAGGVIALVKTAT